MLLATQLSAATLSGPRELSAYDREGDEHDHEQCTTAGLGRHIANVDMQAPNMLWAVWGGKHKLDEGATITHDPDICTPSIMLCALSTRGECWPSCPTHLPHMVFAAASTG